MISKLPRWIWFGGWVLSFCAGMVNVVGLIGFGHTGISHLTSSTSRVGISLVNRDWSALLFLCGLAASFLLGAVISGWVIRSSTLELGRHYTSALLFESFLLTAAVVMFQRHSVAGMYLACCACGLQNAMASKYSGAIIRTTHVTGLFTDIGIVCGQALHGQPMDWRRLLLCSLIIFGFVTGGVCGALVFPTMNYAALLIPAAITGAAAIGYRVYRLARGRDA